MTLHDPLTRLHVKGANATTMPGPLIRPHVLLRLEGAVELILALVLYGVHGGNWALFALLLFVPDLSALGYLASPAAGGASYNAAHTYVLPVALGVVGLASGHILPLQLALIWGAHIAMDRLLGYGLKYPDAFKHTHLGSEDISGGSGAVRAVR